jgi:hypothetical protein
MAGRSLMIAVALSAIALAASSGCAGPSDFAAQTSFPNGTSAYAATASASEQRQARAESPALQMALATEAAAAGPTPAYATAQNPDFEAALRGYMPAADTGPAPLTLTVAVAPGHMYGPSAGLVAMPGSGDWRPLEISVAGPAASSGLDFSVSHQAGSDQGPTGLATTSGAEVRIGQGLASSLAPRFRSPTSWSHPAWYIFAASGRQALTFTPSTDPEALNRNFRLQDRVNIGAVQAGISMEAAGLQASLSYVQRQVTTMDAIRHEERAQEDFAGLTLTWRR